MLGPDLRQQGRPRCLHLRQLAAKQHEYAIRALGEHALPCAIGPLLVPGQGADVLGPALDDVIGPGEILASDRTWHGRESSGRGRWRGLRRARHPASGAHTHDKRHDHHGN